MTPDVIKELETKEQSKFHKELLDSTKALVKRSRSKMSERYQDWDLQDAVFRGERAPDLEDRKQAAAGRPEKMVVPNTYAQVSTGVSFLFLLFNQNPKFFELRPSGNEDAGLKREDCENVMERDWRKNEGNSRLYQFLLDVFRFGPGILEVGWTKQISRIKVNSVATPSALNGIALPVMDLGPMWQEVVKYEGNRIRNVSPYRFFPDPTLPLTDFARGEFCGAEEDYTMSQLYQMQADGEVAGVEHIQPLDSNMDKERGGQTRWAWQSDVKAMRGFSTDPGKGGSNISLVTKVQRWIIPKKFMLEENKPLGQETFPVLYDIWYANDNRIICLEEANTWHNEFGWAVAQFNPDMHRMVNLGMADLIYMLQDVISWFINSHITSVRRVIANRLIIDPKIIDTKTLDGEGDIYLRKSVSVPLDRAFAQAKIQDVTAGHMADSDTLMKLMEVVTGVNGNMQGQYSEGRRSAYQSRVVAGASAGRMKMHGHLVWDSGLGRIGRLMFANSRQSLSDEEFLRIIGEAPDQAQRLARFRGTPEEIARGDDYMMFDSTLESEKQFMAQSLQELLALIISNPVAGQQLDISAKAMLEDIQRLRGAGDIRRYSLSQRVQNGEETAPMPIALPSPSASAQ